MDHRPHQSAAVVGLLTAAAPGDFPATESLRVISIVVVGGLSSVGGAVLGAFFVIGLPELFNNSVQVGLLTSGAGMLVLLLYFPGGLVQVLYNLRDAALAWPEGCLRSPPRRWRSRRCQAGSASPDVRLPPNWTPFSG